MAKVYTFFLLLLLGYAPLLAQKNFTITGTVRDKKETLPGAAIYLSGYKAATTTNNDGRFVLANLQPGNYDVLVQMIGYAPISKNVSITDRSVDVTITLEENATILSEVIIKPDPNRPYYLSMFKKFFIGESANAAKCKLLNTDMLIINDDTKQQMLTVKASDFLVVENQALGYRVKYLLEAFEYDYKNKMVYYAGLPAFEELKGGSAKQKRWKKEREIAYQGSNEHFFRSLVANNLEREGFLLWKRSSINNPNRLPDSLINAKIKQLTTGQNAAVNLIRYNGGSDSLSYWMKKKSEPKTINMLSRAPILVDTLVKQSTGIFKYMEFKDELYVVFKNETEPADFTFKSHKQARPMDIGDVQVSVIKRISPKIFLYPNGAVANPRSMLFSGIWAYQKMADSVPLDYVSIKPGP